MTTPLDRLRELEAAATPGPWRIREETDAEIDAANGWWIGPPARPEDAALIAEARNALPDLLAVVEAAREHYDEWARVNNIARLPLPIQKIGHALAALTTDSRSGTL